MSDCLDAADAERALHDRKLAFAGEPYQDASLTKHRMDCHKLLYAYNSFQGGTFKNGAGLLQQFGPDERYELLRKLFAFEEGEVGMTRAKKLMIEPPFWCDYGDNVVFAGEFYANRNCHLLDGNKISFGHRVMLAPLVQIYAATHSVETEERRAGWQRAHPVTIGDDCWIGGGAIIIGPCTIGNNCTVAAGAVVRGTYPDNVVIGGNPAKIIKRLEPPPALKEAMSFTSH